MIINNPIHYLKTKILWLKINFFQLQQIKDMLYKYGNLKWKYLQYFQNNEFNDLVSKEIIEFLYLEPTYEIYPIRTMRGIRLHIEVSSRDTID